MTADLSLVMYVAAGVLCVGLFGALSRRDQVGALLSLGVMASGVTLGLVALARFLAHARTDAQVAALFVVAIAAAQIAVGLSVVMRLRTRRTAQDEEEEA